jgi:hypothetical protein
MRQQARRRRSVGKKKAGVKSAPAASSWRESADGFGARTLDLSDYQFVRALMLMKVTRPKLSYVAGNELA